MCSQFLKVELFLSQEFASTSKLNLSEKAIICNHSHQFYGLILQKYVISFQIVLISEQPTMLYARLYEIMSTRTNLLPGMLRILCRIIRTHNRQSRCPAYPDRRALQLSIEYHAVFGRDSLPI